MTNWDQYAKNYDEMCYSITKWKEKRDIELKGKTHTEEIFYEEHIKFQIICLFLVFRSDPAFFKQE